VWIAPIEPANATADFRSAPIGETASLSSHSSAILKAGNRWSSNTRNPAGRFAHRIRRWIAIANLMENGGNRAAFGPFAEGQLSQGYVR
jgi:hypothetical protein